MNEPTLIAEDLLLLLLDDQSGKAAKRQELPAALGGALLVELALGGWVDVEPTGLLGGARVHLRDLAPPDDPTLREAFAVAAQKEWRPQSLVEKLGKHATEKVAARLVEHGMVRHEEDRVLGLIPRHRWPATDTVHQEQVRRRLADVLTSAQTPDDRTGALIALLSAIDLAHKVVDHPGLSNREVKREAKRIAEGDWAAKAVRDSVQAAAGAAGAAAVAASAAAASS